MEHPRLLIVDDMEINLDILCDLLESYETIPCSVGADAYHLAKKHQPDLILLDIVMPEVDGFEVCYQLKNDPATSQIPIIFITANDDDESIENAFEMGGVDYITKPFRALELLSRIATHLKLSTMLRNLEEVVEEEIANRKAQEKMLIRQSKMASLGEMIDAVAHQWKQPLNSISLANDLLLTTSLSEELDKEYIQEHCQITHSQIEHMVDTLSEFRNFLRPNKNITAFALSKVVDGIKLLVKDEFMREQITISDDVQSAQNIYGNEMEIKHVVLNIVNNAKDAFVDNKIKDRKIHIAHDSDHNHDIITITDNAGGIPEHIIDDIFKPDVTTKPEGKGTGVGLYMSTQIIQKHGGTLSVHNVRGGASFVITLPLKSVTPL